MHLEDCADCRKALAQYDLIGREIRGLPEVEPSPDAYTKLMRALAVEHARFIQNTASSETQTSTPTFLAPYLKQIHNDRQDEVIAAFSTAETGPLPMIAATARPRRAQHSYPMPQLAIIGLAAVFLMVLMTGGLASLLLLAKPGEPTSSTSASLAQSQPQVTQLSYSTATLYTHVTSAVADQKSIYYSAYGDGSTGWMIEQFERKTRLSQPLLAQASPTPLIVLGSSNDWLLWLMLGAPQSKASDKHSNTPAGETTRPWSLQARFIGNNQLESTSSTSTPEPVTLLKNTFDPASVPGGVYTPVQGIWLIQDTLLVAMVDGKGSSHLWKVQLNAQKNATLTQIASAPPGHILSSPTSTSDGRSLYWSEEWLSNDNVPHSNIWTQQAVAVPLMPGRWAPHTVTSKYLFRSDEMSFHPQVVNNTLFLLSTNPTDTTDATQGTPAVSPTATPASAPTSSSDLNTTVTARTNTSLYPEQTQIDDAVRGTLLTFAADGSGPVQLPQLPSGSVKQASGLQGGEGFVIWQDSNNTFRMYDETNKSRVNVNVIVPKDTAFLAVNGDTAVWTVNKDSSTDSASGGNTTTSMTPPAISFNMFAWPTAAVTQNGQ
jgi:hypothetical protein